MDQFNFDTYPNTDFNKVNLDWMMEQFPELEARIQALEAGGGGAAGDSVFHAVYGITSFTDLQTALWDGLLPYLEESDDYYTLLMIRPFNISFFRMSGSIVYVAICNDTNGWSKYQTEYVTTQSPHFSGIPTAPTAPAGTNSAQIATTAFVKTAIDAIPQGGGGTDDYEDLDNKPSINGVELIGNKTGAQLGIDLDPADIQAAVDDWLDDHAASIDGLSFEAKNALLALLRHVAYVDANGQQYYTALENALIEGATLDSITAVFTQGSAAIYDTDSLDSLRQYLVVTANYSDNTTATVSDYTLTGTLTIGTSTITVSYSDKTTTFDVIVSERYEYSFSGGSLTKLSGTMTTIPNDGGLALNLSTYQQGRRRLFMTETGSLKVKYTTINSGATANDFEDSDCYPIPVPADATSVVCAITPSSQYFGITGAVLADGKYSQMLDDGWKQGSRSLSFVAGTYTHLFINCKYDSSGSSYPTEPTEFTITFGRGT